MNAETVVILGGYGLVGIQIARNLCQQRSPKKLVLASLFEHEAARAISEISAEFPDTEVVGAHGNIFVRREYAYLPPSELLTDEQRILQIYRDTFEPLDPRKPDNILNTSHLTQIIREHRPDVLVDAINTATGISYGVRDHGLTSTTHRVYRFHTQAADRLSGADDELLARAEAGDPEAAIELANLVRELRSDYLGRLGAEDAQGAMNNRLQTYIQLVSQIVPQLVRHVVLLHKACREVETRLYLKIGTTGTGGMGLNIPYTHGEHRPSFPLMAKSSVGFAHSGLLFLLARTPGPTCFKEIKPAALIGYRKVDVRHVRKWGLPVELADPRSESLSELKALDTRDPEAFTADGKLELPGVDTGENGFFARGEFEAITYLGQMECVTPEEIAAIAVNEISGRNTGKDVVQGLGGAVLDPSYRGGFLRPIALADLKELETSTETPSVAIGQLGPPQLTKLLFETHLLSRIHPSVSAWVKEEADDASIAARLEEELRSSGLDRTITSLGVPIRLPDGDTILRGARITIPESVERRVPLTDPADFDEWTAQGWVDLRPVNVARWRQRFLNAATERKRSKAEGSAVYAKSVYPYDEIRAGEIVGWIFNHEPLLGEEAVGGRLW